MTLNEQTSSRVAWIAARGLQELTTVTPDEIRTVFASVVTQAPEHGANAVLRTIEQITLGRHSPNWLISTSNQRGSGRTIVLRLLPNAGFACCGRCGAVNRYQPMLAERPTTQLLPFYSSRSVSPRRDRQPA